MVPWAVPPASVIRTVTLSAGSLWWTVPAQLPANWAGMDRGGLSRSLSAETRGEAFGLALAPGAVCRPAM